MSLIYDCVKRSVPVERYPKEGVAKLIASLRTKGAEAFLMACTELPIAFEGSVIAKDSLTKRSSLRGQSSERPTRHCVREGGEWWVWAECLSYGKLKAEFRRIGGLMA